MTQNDAALSTDIGRAHQRDKWMLRRIGAYRRRLMIEAERKHNPHYTAPDQLDRYLACLREDLETWALASQRDEDLATLAEAIYALDKQRRGSQ